VRSQSNKGLRELMGTEMFGKLECAELRGNKLNYAWSFANQLGIHLINFGKTRKISLQQFDKPTWQK
jgi:hypothetical protein